MNNLGVFCSAVAGGVMIGAGVVLMAFGWTAAVAVVLGVALAGIAYVISVTN